MGYVKLNAVNLSVDSCDLVQCGMVKCGEAAETDSDGQRYSKSG